MMLLSRDVVRSLVLTLAIFAATFPIRAHAEAVTIDFDDVVVQGGCSLVPSDTYGDDGIAFRRPIPVTNVEVLEPWWLPTFVAGGGSVPNAMVLSSAVCDGSLTAEADFRVPESSAQAVTDFVEVLACDSEGGSTVGTLEAFDIGDGLIESVTATTPGAPLVGGCAVLTISAPGIASIRLSMDADGGDFDNLTFNSPQLFCAATPVAGCVGPEKGILLVKEKVAGKEKVKAVINKLKPAVSQSDLGDPVEGTTSYHVCIYDQNDAIIGSMVVDRAGQDCGTPPKPCWKNISTKGYKYKDQDTSADGIMKIIAKGGDPGKGKVIVLGKNTSGSLPPMALALQNNTKATVQVVTSDADCFGVTTDDVKRADGSLFKALGGSPSSAFIDMASGVLD